MIDAIEAKLDNGTYGLSVLQTLLIAIETLLTDIEGTGFTKDTHSLVNITGYVDEIEGLLKNVSYGLSALKTLIDAVEGKLDNATYGLSALKTAIDDCKSLHDLKTYKTAVFDASASGNLVAASTTGKVIKLHALIIQAQGTVVVNLNNGAAGASLMEWSFQAREGAVIPMANAPAYWAITEVNTALYVTLSAAVVVTITAVYSDDDAS